MDEHQEKLFELFPPVKTEEWELKINEDLKGADYRKKLIWNTAEGFEVKPYYRVEDTADLFATQLKPEEFPFTRGNSAHGNNWGIKQDIETDDIAEANIIAKDAISRGATEIGLVATELTNTEKISQILDGINSIEVPIHFIAADVFPEFLDLFSGFAKTNKLPVDRIKGSFDFDPISTLLLNGEFKTNEENDLHEIALMIEKGKTNLPSMKVINVNAHYFHSAGATLSQELGYALAMGCEYINIAISQGFTIDDIAPRIMFSFAIGSNYFMEIAKLRAARQLWAIITKQYQPTNEDSCRMYIHCNTSSWNKTLYDPYVNVLRTTTEAMSAILGGAQSLNIVPFDTFFKDPDEFSNRIARNQQIILKEESYLDKVADPAAGSYYIENLTQLLSQAAWDVFLATEEKGGILKAIKTGWVQDEVEKSAEIRRNDIANRKIILLGTNQYPNQQEEMLEKIHFSEDDEWNEEEMYADENTEIIDEDEEETTYKKMELFGASDDFDQMRLSTEQFRAEHGKTPSVFLLNIGNLAMRKARAMFTSNFFGCAGFQSIDNSGFDTVDEGVKAALDSKAEIVTICSSDEEYATLGIEIAQKLKASLTKPIVVVAGYPKEIIEQLQNAGVDDFIHVRCNVIESLENFQEKLGII